MGKEDNIIAVRSKSLSETHEAFADFMCLLESYLNQQASTIPGKYRDCKSKDLELVVVNAMKELCASTPFRSEDIRLVSSQYFPDILAGRHYGVEVKST